MPQASGPNIYSCDEYEVAQLFSGKDRGRAREAMSVRLVVVGSNLMVMALPNCRILRWRTIGGQEPEEIEISRGGQKADDISRLFLDPHGHHLLICMRLGDVYYLHSRSQRPKRLSSWNRQGKGGTVEAVAFDKHQVSENLSKSVLVGTSDGEIYEAVLDSSGKDRPLMLLYTLEERVKICALHLVVDPGGSGNPEGQRIFVLAATASPTRLYSFLGGPTLEALFADCREQGRENFSELGSSPLAELHCFTPQSQGQGHSLFALLTERGIYHGSLQFSSTQQFSTEVIVEPRLMPYGEGAMGQSVPLSLNISEFHFLLLYHDSLRVLSRISGELVQTLPLKPTQQVIGLVRDVARDGSGAGLWLYSERCLYQVNIHDEGRDVWRLYLNKALAGDERKFQNALETAKTDTQRSTVQEQQALFYFGNGDYERAARYFALAEHRPFEEIALRFLGSGQEAALVIFLEEKLKQKQMAPNKDKVQQKMLSTWITQLYLQRFIYMDSSDAEAIDEAHRRFTRFLEENRDTLDKATTYQLLSGHGRADDLLLFAMLIGDYERVVAHHVAIGNVEEALETLDAAPFDAVRGLFYKFSSVFMETIPKKTVAVWKAKPDLHPTKLIPALVRYNQRQKAAAEGDLSFRSSGGGLLDDTNYAIDFLEHCVENQPNLDKAIHNYLVLLHAQGVDEEPLLAFLERGERDTFDLEYALRVCTQHNQQAACVRIYSAMELYEEAVQLALQVDVELAKTNADRPKEAEVRKRLWLVIAKHTIESQSDTQQAMHILKECPLLKIEDILPFFRDFVTIDDFKTKIVESLEEYDAKIDKLKAQMDEHTQSAKGIHKEIEQLQERKFTVPSSEVCALSGRPILSGPFYVFPSNYAYLADELTGHVLPHLEAKKQARVEELQVWLTSTDTPAADRLVYQAEFDNLIAAECPLTGNIMIESIDRSLVSPEELKKQAATWAI